MCQMLCTHQTADIFSQPLSTLQERRPDGEAGNYEPVEPHALIPHAAKQ